MGFQIIEMDAGIRPPMIGVYPKNAFSYLHPDTAPRKM
jgi:hypothetical protein